MLGRWPIEDADHKDRVRNNNKWENLREATRQQNNFNTSLNITNKLGVKGVSIVVESGKYKAQIRINGIVTILGICDTEQEAAKLYDVKSKELHGEFYFNPN